MASTPSPLSFTGSVSPDTSDSDGDNANTFLQFFDEDEHTDVGVVYPEPVPEAGGTTGAPVVISSPSPLSSRSSPPFVVSRSSGDSSPSSLSSVSSADSSSTSSPEDTSMFLAQFDEDAPVPVPVPVPVSSHVPAHGHRFQPVPTVSRSPSSCSSPPLPQSPLSSSSSSSSSSASPTWIQCDSPTSSGSEDERRRVPATAGVRAPNQFGRTVPETRFTSLAVEPTSATPSSPAVVRPVAHVRLPVSTPRATQSADCVTPSPWSYSGASSTSESCSTICGRVSRHLALSVMVSVREYAFRNSLSLYGVVLIPGPHLSTLVRTTTSTSHPLGSVLPMNHYAHDAKGSAFYDRSNDGPVEVKLLFSERTAQARDCVQLGLCAPSRRHELAAVRLYSAASTVRLAAPIGTTLDKISQWLAGIRSTLLIPARQVASKLSLVLAPFDPASPSKFQHVMEYVDVLRSTPDGDITTTAKRALKKYVPVVFVDCDSVIPPILGYSSLDQCRDVGAQRWLLWQRICAERLRPLLSPSDFKQIISTMPTLWDTHTEDGDAGVNRDEVLWVVDPQLCGVPIPVPTVAMAGPGSGSSSGSGRPMVVIAITSDATTLSMDAPELVTQCGASHFDVKMPTVSSALALAYVALKSGGERNLSVGVMTRHRHIGICDNDNEPAILKGTSMLVPNARIGGLGTRWAQEAPQSNLAVDILWTLFNLFRVQQAEHTFQLTRAGAAQNVAPMQSYVYDAMPFEELATKRLAGDRWESVSKSTIFMDTKAGSLSGRRSRPQRVEATSLGIVDAKSFTVNYSALALAEHVVSKAFTDGIAALSEAVEWNTGAVASVALDVAMATESAILSTAGTRYASWPTVILVYGGTSDCIRLCRTLQSTVGSVQNPEAIDLCKTRVVVRVGESDCTSALTAMQWLSLRVATAQPGSMLTPEALRVLTNLVTRTRQCGISSLTLYPTLLMTILSVLAWIQPLYSLPAETPPEITRVAATRGLVTAMESLERLITELDNDISIGKAQFVTRVEAILKMSADVTMPVSTRDKELRDGVFQLMKSIVPDKSSASFDQRQSPAVLTENIQKLVTIMVTNHHTRMVQIIPSLSKTPSCSLGVPVVEPHITFVPDSCRADIEVSIHLSKLLCRESGMYRSRESMLLPMKSRSATGREITSYVAMVRPIPCLALLISDSVAAPSMTNDLWDAIELACVNSGDTVSVHRSSSSAFDSIDRCREATHSSGRCELVEVFKSLRTGIIGAVTAFTDGVSVVSPSDENYARRTVFGMYLKRALAALTTLEGSIDDMSTVALSSELPACENLCQVASDVVVWLNEVCVYLHGDDGNAVLKMIAEGTQVVQSAGERQFSDPILAASLDTRWRRALAASLQIAQGVRTLIAVIHSYGPSLSPPSVFVFTMSKQDTGLVLCALSAFLLRMRTDPSYTYSMEDKPLLDTLFGDNVEVASNRWTLKSSGGAHSHLFNGQDTSSPAVPCAARVACAFADSCDTIRLCHPDVPVKQVIDADLRSPESVYLAMVTALTKGSSKCNFGELDAYLVNPVAAPTSSRPLTRSPYSLSGPSTATLPQRPLQGSGGSASAAASPAQVPDQFASSRTLCINLARRQVLVRLYETMNHRARFIETASKILDEAMQALLRANFSEDGDVLEVLNHMVRSFHDIGTSICTAERNMRAESEASSGMFAMRSSFTAEIEKLDGLIRDYYVPNEREVSTQTGRYESLLWLSETTKDVSPLTIQLSDPIASVVEWMHAFNTVAIMPAQSIGEVQSCQGVVTSGRDNSNVHIIGVRATAADDCQRPQVMDTTDLCTSISSHHGRSQLGMQWRVDLLSCGIPRGDLFVLTKRVVPVVCSITKSLSVCPVEVTLRTLSPVRFEDDGARARALPSRCTSTITALQHSQQNPDHGRDRSLSTDTPSATRRKDAHLLSVYRSLLLADASNPTLQPLLGPNESPVRDVLHVGCRSGAASMEWTQLPWPRPHAQGSVGHQQVTDEISWLQPGVHEGVLRPFCVYVECAHGVLMIQSSGMTTTSRVDTLVKGVFEDRDLSELEALCATGVLWPNGHDYCAVLLVKDRKGHAHVSASGGHAVATFHIKTCHSRTADCVYVVSTPSVNTVLQIVSKSGQRSFIGNKESEATAAVFGLPEAASGARMASKLPPLVTSDASIYLPAGATIQVHCVCAEVAKQIASDPSSHTTLAPRVETRVRITAKTCDTTRKTLSTLDDDCSPKPLQGAPGRKTWTMRMTPTVACLS